MRNNWVEVLLVVVVGIALANARPKDEVYPVYNADDSLKRLSPSGNEGKEKLTIEDLANVARADNDNPSLSPAVAKVADQLMSTIGEMVEKDIRTPPKLKDVAKDETEVKNVTKTTLPVLPVVVSTASSVEKVEANGKFQIRGAALAGDTSEGKAANTKKDEGVKGVAVPVIMEDEDHKNLQKIPNVNKPPKDEKKKTVSTHKPMKETPTTTPSSGLSTWILLSDNKESTTPSTTPKRKTVSITTTKKPVKSQVTTTPKSSTAKPSKKTSEKPDKKVESLSVLETMVKNKKNNAVSRPSQKKKGDGVDTKDNLNNDNRRVATIPPAIVVDSTVTATTESSNGGTSLETTTKKKKTSTKKRKKNKNRRKNPSEKSGEDQVIKDLIKQPKQPVGAQFYNFLSREIMPTVGLGLVGVLVTAGLAGLLGYNPFNGNTIPVRRTYESQHGYNPNNHYYNYNGAYAETDTGKNEEVLFQEVLSGMPENSRYGVSNADATYPESQIYNSQELAYETAKSPSTSQLPNNDGAYGETYGSHYDAYSSKDQISGKYPVYSSGYVYPDVSTEKFKASAKFSEDEPIEKQPEALYRVSGDMNTAQVSASDDSATTDGSWHRIGSAMESSNTHLEPGPRRLDLEKMTEQLTKGVDHRRTKRSPESILTRIVRRSNEVVNVKTEDERENEIDVDENTGKPATETTESSTSTSETPSLMESFPSDLPPTTPEPPPSLMDVLKRLAQFKFRLGVNFLKATTDAFGKYLEGVQQRVEETMANDTSFPAMRYAWLGREAVDDSIREKRYQRATQESESNS